MELLIGFVLGVTASVLASFIVSWITALLPVRHRRRVFAAIRNPVLFIRYLRDTDERRIRDRIYALFEAWRQKDLNRYLSRWADDCVRIVGTKSTVKEDKSAIAARFRRSSARYSQIRIPALVVENVRIGPDPKAALAEVYYTFNLTRVEDSLPVVEHAREFYSLRKTNGDWLIASNIDHFAELGS